MGSTGGSESIITTQAQDRTINQIIRRTRDLKNEQYRIVDEEGNIVLERKGARHEVVGTVGEKRQFMEGGVGIHNHPEGGTFSLPDLRDFGFSARQIVAASPEGTYKLTNLNYNNRMKRTAGWRDMQEAMEKAGVDADVSFTELQKQAREAPAVKKLGDQISAISDRWVQGHNSGASAEAQQKLMDEYNRLSDQYKKMLRDERRRLETAPYHEFYKKNARKYGFKYEFIPR